MGLRIQKRVNLGKGMGLNVSKSGISASHRGKYGAIGSKGYSIRTGIPGVSFRGSFSKNSSAASAMVGLFFIITVSGIVVAYNVIRFIVWLVKEIYHYHLRRKYDREHKNDLVVEAEEEQVS